MTGAAGIDRADHVAAVAEHGRALLDLARDHPDTRVASCPGFDLTDLAGHVGQVWANVAGVVRARMGERPPRPERPDDRAAWLPWADAALDRLGAELAGLDPDEAVWNWSVQPDVGRFWLRRMAQENTVHRWDAETAAGGSWTIPTALAVEGIDEFFEAFLPRAQASGPLEGFAASLHLHATDADGEWLLDLQPSTFTVRHEHSKGDAALRGPASDLLLWVWNRVPADHHTLTGFGDTSVFERWAALVRI